MKGLERRLAESEDLKCDFQLVSISQFGFDEYFITGIARLAALASV
jgi:hypothetical protein